MDLISSSINLHKILNEICTFFMHIFKDDVVPNLPNFELLYESCPDENRLKVISFLISAAIDIFATQSHRTITVLIGNKIGLWRTLVVRLCQNHCADKHHLPFEIDIIASRNKLVVESLIFDWPFCNEIASQLLQYFCEAFHGTNNVNQPYIDDYVSKFKPKYRRTEAVKVIVLGMKWVHTVQGSPNYEQTKHILKQNVINCILMSDVLMKNREGQFEEIWNEIVAQLDTYDEFDPSRIDSFPFYCQINPVLKPICDLLRVLFTEENSMTDFSKIIGNFHEMSEKYESAELWGLELTNNVLAALNTIMIEMVFRKCKVFPKISENNMKMFINAIAVHESISQMVLMSEVNYWVDRLKRKRVELPAQFPEFFSGNWNMTTNESVFTKILDDYILKVLDNESGSVPVPGLVGSIETKPFQSMVTNSIKSVTTSLLMRDSYCSPIGDNKILMISKIVDKMAQHHGVQLQSHFLDKIDRILHKFNSTIFKKNNTSPDKLDSKSFIVPLMDGVDYRKFVTEIWKFVNQSNIFLKPISIQDYLIDIRQELMSQIPPDQADRIVSRIMFYTGWRFRLRSMEVMSSEMFRFHLVFNFLSQNLPSKSLVEENMNFWMRKLSGIDCSKSVTKGQTPSPFQINEFFMAQKLENVQSHIVQVLRGSKNISIPNLTDVPFSSYNKGLESTKAILQILRSVFSLLNEDSSRRHKHDNVKNWLSHMKTLETDLHIICSKLDADRLQVLAELMFLISFIVTSLGADDSTLVNSYRKLPSNYHQTIYLDRDVSDEELLKLPAKRGAVKQEAHDRQEIDGKSKLGLKKKLIDMEQEEPKMKKLCRGVSSLDDNNYRDGDDIDEVDYPIKFESRISEKPTIHSKVNFINSSSDITIGEMIESRITYISEPNLKSICIDPGKGKSRPPKYIQISACPNRNPITIVKKPVLTQKRHKTSPVKLNESKILYNFNIIREVGNGTFGKIFEAVDKFSNRKVALKRITLTNRENGIPQAILREIFLYKSVNHPNLIQFIDIVVNEIESIKSKFSDLEVIVPKSFYFVFDYVEHDLHGLLKSKSMIFSLTQIGFLSRQLFSGLAYLHDKNIIHRDIIPSNLMITNQGILKIADFGNARLLIKDVQLDNNLSLTPKTVPFLYRAPEILMELETYGTEVDMWSAGCVIYELFTGSILWSSEKENSDGSESVFEHISNIAKVLGSPNSVVWQSVNQSKHYISLVNRNIVLNYSRKIDDHMKTIPYDAADVLKQIFQWDPAKRMTARNALGSNWLVDIEMESIMSTEFPDKDCHELLLLETDRTNVVPLAIGEESEDSRSKTTTITTTAATKAAIVDDSHLANIYDSTNNNGGIVVVANNNGGGNGGLIINNTSNEMVGAEDEEIKEEDLMRFVDSLSGRILELADVLDRMRNEPVCTADIVKGVVMRAARVWSGTEAIRLRMVTFMLDYLLKPDEKQKLGF